MKKNLYYRDVVQRKNPLTPWLLNWFNAFSSSSRLLLEVFIRKNFGERYLNLYSVITLAISLAILPVLFIEVPALLGNGAVNPNQFGGMTGFEGAPVPQKPSYMPQYLGWYAFIVAFVGMGVKHCMDNRHNPSVFDFRKYSLSTGDINPIFLKVKIPGVKTDVRVVECLIEPLGFFVAGFLLWLIGQHLGYLLMFMSICYSLNYIGAYMGGDHFVMDKIDQIIINEEMEKAFVNDEAEDKTRGFRFRGQKPETDQMRRQLLPLMVDEEEILTAK